MSLLYMVEAKTKTHIYILLVISGILLFGSCNKKEIDDTYSGKGTIVYEGVEYQLDRITQNTSLPSVSQMVGDKMVWNYIHKLEFISSDNQNKVNITIISPTEALTPGEYRLENTSVIVLGKSIQANLYLTESSVYHELSYVTPSISLSLNKKSDNIYELEIKETENEIFLNIKWMGAF